MAIDSFFEMPPGNASSNTTTSYVGFIYLLGSSVFFGSNYLPVKQYETGDGMFFQLVLCLAIWTTGLVVHAIRSFPPFYALPMLGGFFWTTGNIVCVPIIKLIGMGLGLLVWCGIELIGGWTTARFGLFGLNAEIPSLVMLNYAGLGLILLSMIFYFFVKPKTENLQSQQLNEDEDSGPLIDEPIVSVDQHASIFNTLGGKTKRVLGFALAGFCGVMFSQINTPILYIRDHYKDASINMMDHIFSMFTGILLSSIIYFVLYCVAKRNRPVLYPQIIIPTIYSGWMWGVAEICFFLSLNTLPQPVSFPISTSGPSIVANMWGIFLYKEIKGCRNFAFLLVGFSISFIGAVLTGISL